MEILLFAEMNDEGVARFRELFRQQLGQEYERMIGPFTKEDARKQFWREKTMYPTYLCREGSAKNNAQVRVAYYEEEAKDRHVSLKMRERFALGYWMHKARMTQKECMEMRTSIQDYMTRSHDVVNIYGQLLEYAEPKGLIKETLVFQASRPKQAPMNKVVDLTQDTKEPEGGETGAPGIPVPCNAWPCSVHPCT